MPPAASTARWQSRCLGPGWFDSSFELQHGLDVEDGSNDAMALRFWLDHFLSRRDALGN